MRGCTTKLRLVMEKKGIFVKKGHLSWALMAVRVVVFCFVLGDKIGKAFDAGEIA